MKKSNNSDGEKIYQINPSYLLREIAGEHAIIPIGEDCLISNAVMTPNHSAAFIWNVFMTPCTEEEAVQKVLQEYEGEAEDIRVDVHRFIKDTLNYKILREVK